MDLTAAKFAISKANKYTDETAEGVGIQRGKNCQIQSVTDITGGHRVTFAFYDEDQVLKTETLDVMDGEKGETGEQGETGPRGPEGPRGGGATIIDVAPASDSVYSSAKVENLIQEIRSELAGGAKSYAISYADAESDNSNGAFNSQNASITVNLKLVNVAGEDILLSDLHVGDNIFVTEVNVPDRWVGNIENGVATLYILETTSVDLSNYVQKSEIETETWTFTTSDESTLTREVVIANGD